MVPTEELAVATRVESHNDIEMKKIRQFLIDNDLMPKTNDDFADSNVVIGLLQDYIKIKSN